MASLPIIPLASLLSGGTGRADTVKALHKACRDYGFFYLNIEGFVSRDETDQLTSLAHQFFQSPQQTKDAISLRNSDLARGYARLNENVTNGKADAHEGIDFYRPVDQPDKTKPLWGENQWPDIPDFRARYEKWIEKMQELGLIVMEAMAAGLGVTSDEWNNLRSLVDESFWVMRIIGYPPLPNDHDGFSCGAHKDYGCLTFLYADPTPSALQVFIQDSDTNLLDPPTQSNGTLKSEVNGEQKGRWINADPIPDCVVCNIGEMWEIWTNGLYSSTLHRVIHRGTNYRISIPFFFEPNFTALISPLPAIARLSERGDVLKLEKDRKKHNGRNTVVYGQFLMKKVAGNFTEGKGKYDS